MRRLRHRTISGLLLGFGALGAALLLGPSPAAAGGVVAGTVSVKGRLAVRVAATSAATQTEALTNRTAVDIVCQVTGEKIKGRVRTTDRWDRLTNGRYVSDAFVRRDRSVPVPVCAPTVVPALGAAGPADLYSLTGPAASFETTLPAWVVPVPHTAVGGFRTVARPSHDGVDLPQPRNTPIVAVAAGTVVTVKCNTDGPSCDVDGSPSTRGCGWYVEVRHVGDVVTRYCHMVRQPAVAVGDTVTVGQLIGHVGTSGHSSGTHLHFEVHLGYPANSGNAVDPVPFMQQVGAPLLSDGQQPAQ